ncbi:MAG TPA: TonB-dependent receptor plug domain-containing protein, partial [Oceanipulchritudo sp.]|nr:TonB-dependent receptor plug domain-containing protein [Oceanipulchritudo sp.]
MKQMNSLHNNLKSIGRILISASLLVTASAQAQDTPAEDKEVFELSPFEVSTEGSIGYLANNTLAGTRLNSQLKDIANSVQVVTKEFLEDTGASNYNELLLYTTSTEVGGIGGNATLDQLDSQTQRDEFSKREPQFYTRVRGLAKLDLARDYFLSDMDLDSYITSEVTINRGPNAALFGLGSPGGISNSAIDRAMTDRSFGEINFRTDEYGSVRASLNYNQVVIKDKLAVRVAALSNSQKYEQKQAVFDDDRYFIAATLRPMWGITLRANYETGDGFGNRPVTRLPTDRITPWIANGKPSYNPLTQEWFVGGQKVTNTTYISQLNASTTQFATMAANGNPSIIFDDPNSPFPGNNGYAVIQPGLQGNAAGRTSTTLPVSGGIYMRQFQGWRALINRDPNYIVGANPAISSAEVAYYNDVQLTDFSVFNPREYSVTGASEWQSQEFEVYSFRAEKTWLDNTLGLELAYQDQYWESDHMVNQSASSGGNLAVDINTVLLDGSPNPNFGRPFVGGRGFAQGRIREREALQAIGFAKYNFAEKHDGWLKHFGDHTLTAVFQDQTNNELQPNRMNARASNSYNVSLARGGPGLSQANEFATSSRVQGNTRPSFVQYLGPSMANISSIQEASIQGVTVPQFFQNT